MEFSTGSDDATAKVEIVPASEIEGMRKVKHLTVSLATTGTTGMYEPNQFVMNCGVIDPSAGPIRFTSPVSRNLNDGDSIYLCVRNTNNQTAVTHNAVVRYAITLQ